MELDPADDSIVENFDAFSKKIDRFHSQITTRKMMTDGEKRHLEIMLNQIKHFGENSHQEKDHLKEKILYLLKKYYSIFD